MLFCHQEFLNANFGFIISTKGVIIPPNARPMISGHIHKTQQLQSVWYPGTPFAQEASDHNEIKGLYIYDTNDGSKLFIESPLPQWVTSRATIATFNQTVEMMNKKNKNHLVVTGPNNELTALVESREFQMLKREYGFTVKKDPTSHLKSSKSIRRVSTIEDAVVEYIDRIYDGTMDKTLLKEKCLRVLQ